MEILKKNYSTNNYSSLVSHTIKLSKADVELFHTSLTMLETYINENNPMMLEDYKRKIAIIMAYFDEMQHDY